MTSKLFKNAIFIDIHTHSSTTSGSTLKIYSYDPYLSKNLKSNTHFSCGIHPWSLEYKNHQKLWLSVSKLIKEEKCLFIGETGLDKTSKVPLSTQMEFFYKHIEISNKLRKPLIIHCVKALDEILQIRAKIDDCVPWVLHDFNGNEQMIKRCLNFNIYFSLGRRFYTSPSSKIAKALEFIPKDKLFFETDNNEELEVSQVYHEYCTLTGSQLGQLCEQVKTNLGSLI